MAGSLAIMTDAAHLASDCISFVIGLVAIWLGTRPPDSRMSFGYKRFGKYPIMANTMLMSARPVDSPTTLSLSLSLSLSYTHSHTLTNCNCICAKPEKGHVSYHPVYY